MAEDEGPVQVCATIITPFMTEFDITVRLTTADDTGMHYTTDSCVISCMHAAIDGFDYLGGNFNLVFTAGSSNNTLCEDIPIANVLSVEEDETFTVILTTDVHIGNSVTTVTITDIDCKIL